MSGNSMVREEAARRTKVDYIISSILYKSHQNFCYRDNEM